MAIIKRFLHIDLPAGQSAFLWGPRKTGKTTYLSQAFPDSVVFDFLKTDLFLAMAKHPALLRERLLAMDARRLAKPVILDEVQKVPQVLDEVHWLIENRGLRFILCGSSARKLRRGQANRRGGRAWRYEMFPLVWAELDQPDLLTILNRGLIPAHYGQADYARSLTAFVEDYLKEEVFAEGLTRNVPAFSRFLDAAGWSHGELINYANIARDCGVDAKTVREYYQILADTLLGSLVEPFKKRQSRQVIGRAPKFFLFDVGVAGSLSRRRIAEEKGEQFGRAFEHFIFMELAAHRSYSALHYPIQFWRTKSGLEVDFVLADGEVVIEVKGAARLDHRELRPLLAFCEEHAPRLALVVCNEPEERLVGRIRILPWRLFLQQLWAGAIIH
ncbi:MAG: AAA family ATPase [Thermodesulfobacteriota bacterium]